MRNATRQWLGVLLALLAGISALLLPGTSSVHLAAQAPATLVIDGGTLIDGNGGAPISDAFVVIQGDRIASVSRRGQATIPASAQVIRADGKFILQEGNEKKLGKWKPGKQPNTLTINYAVNKSVWTVTIAGDLATVERPDINETRYFRVKH